MRREGASCWRDGCGGTIVGGGFQETLCEG